MMLNRSGGAGYVPAQHHAPLCCHASGAVCSPAALKRQKAARQSMLLTQT